MKNAAQSVISTVRQFIDGEDGPVAVLELVDSDTGFVTRELVQLASDGSILPWTPQPASPAMPTRQQTGSFASLAAAAVVLAPVAAAVRAATGAMSRAAPDGILEVATDGTDLFALEGEAGLHDGRAQRLHRFELAGDQCRRQAAPVLEPLRLSARRSITGLAVVGDNLWTMVADAMVGFGIFRLDITDPTAGFLPFVERGAGRFTLNALVSAMAVGPGCLLVGTAALADAHVRVGNWGPELLMLTPQDGWDLLIGQPRLGQDGLKVPASGLIPGLGNTRNAAIKAIATGRAGDRTVTCIALQEFSGKPVPDRRGARPDLFDYGGAVRIFRSDNLSDWQAMPLSLPQGTGPVTALHVTSEALLIGHEALGEAHVPVMALPLSWGSG
jgi:hypothetical protein